MKKTVFLSLLINLCNHLVADITTLDFFALTSQLSTLEKRSAFIPFLIPVLHNLSQQEQSVLATAFKTSFAPSNLNENFVQNLLRQTLKPCPTEEKIEDFFMAIRKGNIAQVTTMLDETPMLLNVRNQIGRTPLIHAIPLRSVPLGDKIIEELLNRGACVDMQDDTGWTALMYAALHDTNSNIVDLLLEQCADTTKKTIENETAEAIAIQHGSTKIAQKIKAHVACKARC